MDEEERWTLIQRIKHVGLKLSEDCKFVELEKGILQLQCLAKPVGKRFGFYPASDVINELEQSFINNRVTYVIEELGLEPTSEFVVDASTESIIRNSLPSSTYPQKLTDRDYEKIIEGIDEIWREKQYEYETEMLKTAKEREIMKAREQEEEERFLRAKSEIHQWEEFGDVFQRKGETWEETKERYLQDYEIDIGEEES